MVLSRETQIREYDDGITRLDAMRGLLRGADAAPQGMFWIIRLWRRLLSCLK